MTKKLNIFELHRTINEKKQRKSECYEKVLEICHKKVITATEHKQLRILFEVPEYVYGFPIFDINECIIFLLKNLKSNGFLVKYYFPKILYISWDFDEIKKTEEQETQKDIQNKKFQENIDKYNQAAKQITQPKQTMPQLTSSLLQPKQASAALKVKPTGRLSLNIF